MLVRTRVLEILLVTHNRSGLLSTVIRSISHSRLNTGADVKFAVIRKAHPGNYLYSRATIAVCERGRPWHRSKVPKTTTLPLRWRLAKGERNKNDRSCDSRKLIFRVGHTRHGI